MARDWHRAVLAASAAAMLSSCSLSISRPQDPNAAQDAVDSGSASWLGRLFGRSSGDSATDPSRENWFRRLFRHLSGEPAPDPNAPAPQPKDLPPPAQPAPTRTEAPANRVKGQYLVQLAAARTEEEAQALATQAKRAYGAVLSGREQSIDRTVLGGMGTFYLVRFGPFANLRETQRVCARLQGSGIDCLPVNP
jgi:hypothetical protein